MIALHLLRHAHAGDPEGWTGPDAARPLSDKGRRQSERLAEFLSSIDFDPDAILTSPKLRAAQTAELLAARLAVAVRPDERLGGGVDVATVEQVLRDAGLPSRPVLVGHDPDFSDLLATLVGSGGLEMKKGAIARIDVDLPLAPGSGVLRWLVPPDLLRGR